MEERFIEVQKNLPLRDGEELGQLINALHDAVAKHRDKTNKSVFLSSIFNRFVVLRDVESGKFFKAEYKRDGDGEIEFSELQEVRQAWVPVRTEEKRATTKAALPPDQTTRVVEVPSLFLVLEKGELTSESKGMLERVAKTILDKSGDVDTEYMRHEKTDLWKGLLS